VFVTGELLFIIFVKICVFQDLLPKLERQWPTLESGQQNAEFWYEILNMDWQLIICSIQFSVFQLNSL